MASPPVQPAAANVTRMHSGEALKPEEASAITRRSYTPIVFLTGPVKCGKTTLVASLHDGFQFGKVGAYSFAGSETLLGFEEAAFESREKSGRSAADTTRTSYKLGQRFFHFRVRQDEPDSVLQDILFADMSGEFYERSLLNSSELNGLNLLTRADFLVLLLDGRKLLEPTTRHQTRDDGLQFIRRCRESNMLRATMTFQVLITKWDLILDNKAEKTIMPYVHQAFCQESVGLPLSIIPIAARPEEGSNIEKLLGLKDLFKQWVDTVPSSISTSTLNIDHPRPKRRFNSLNFQS